KRFDAHVMSQGNGKRFILLPPSKPPLPIQVTITLRGPDGDTLRKQFAANDKVIIQVAMLNNSPQMIVVKESAVVDWLNVTSSQDRPLPFSLLLHLSGGNNGSESAVTVPATPLA